MLVAEWNVLLTVNQLSALKDTPKVNHKDTKKFLFPMAVLHKHD